MEEDTVTMQQVFRFRSQGVDEKGWIKGVTEPTGLRPRIADRLFEMGLEVDEEFRRLFPDGRSHAARQG